MRIKSLSDKIVFYFVIIGITAIAIISTYSFYTSKNALLNRTFDQLTSVRVVKKNQIEQFFNDRLSEFTLITNSAAMRGISIDSSDPQRNQAYNSFQYLLNYLNSGKYFTGIFIEIEKDVIAYYELGKQDSIEFKILTVEKSRLLVNLFNQSRNVDQFIIHDYVMDTVKQLPRMFISGSIGDTNNASINKIAVEISLDAINAIVLQQNPNDGLGLSGESYLVGPDKLMRSASRFQKNSIMHTLVSTDGVEKAFNDFTGTSVIHDYRGVEVLSSYSRINVPGLNWVILAEIDYTEAIKSIYFIRNNIMILTIFVAFIVFVISYIFSKRITLPLIKLTEAAANIKSGNLNVNLPRITHDEIGQLTNSFNGMALSLREKNAELLTERNKRFSAMINGQELERQRLSRELHDGLGQSLIALKLRLEAIDGKDVCAINRTLKEVKFSFDDTINEIRRISNDLMPAVLTEFGLVTALKNICEDIAENTKIEISCSYDGEFGDLENRLTIYIFRIMQESLNNIVKHSKASKATAQLIRKENLLMIKVTDNGIGWNVDNPTKNKGNGISNMRERVRLLEGKMDIHTLHGKGTRISFEIPLKTIANG